MEKLYTTTRVDESAPSLTAPITFAWAALVRAEFDFFSESVTWVWFSNGVHPVRLNEPYDDFIAKWRKYA